MPEFGNPFAGMTAARKLTPEELVRAIRYTVAAEYEAVQLYMQLAESTDNKVARAVLKGKKLIKGSGQTYLAPKSRPKITCKPKSKVAITK